MKTKINLILIVLIINTSAHAKYRIVTSITPIASFAAMLMAPNVEVTAIASSNMCPHHHQARPSDLKTVQLADINIYIDDGFDSFAAKLMHSSPSTLIKISDFKNLKLIRNDNLTNWHFWLDLDNVAILLKELSIIFVEKFPENKDLIYANLKQSLKKIAELSTIKNQQLVKIKQAILLSDSLEYLFLDNKNINKLYEPSPKSLKFFNELSALLSTGFHSKCLILSSDQNFKFYEKFKNPLVQIESENWQMDKDLPNLYFNQYLKVINLIKLCE